MPNEDASPSFCGLTRERGYDLKLRLRTAKNIVVFTGAGASAESGIPTFRDAQVGLWEKYRPEQLASPEAFTRNPALVWGWYEWRRAAVCRAKPNAGHHAVAKWAETADVSVVTQNVDDLHERAGSLNIIHLHGSLFHPRCVSCATPYEPGPPIEPTAEGREIPPPACLRCGKAIRPGVVWFGEELPQDNLLIAEELARESDLMICVGTSGVVYPAAGIPNIARKVGATVVSVNKEPLEKSSGPNDFVIVGNSGDVLPKLVEAATRKTT
jgi:NAD-dependent deacetylase